MAKLSVEGPRVWCFRSALAWQQRRDVTLSHSSMSGCASIKGVLARHAGLHRLLDQSDITPLHWESAFHSGLCCACNFVPSCLFCLLLRPGSDMRQRRGIC